MAYEPGVAVIGGGTWGRALAASAARTESPTWLYSRSQRGLGVEGLSGTVKLVHHLDGIGKKARLFILAVPSLVVRDVARMLGDHLDGRHLVVHAIRGLSEDGPKPLSSILGEEIATRRLGVLGGPAIAEELLRGDPSVLVAASAYPEVTDAVERALGSKRLRVYPTSDMIGVEWSSALVGCLAIGVGYAEAAGVRAGLLAAFISRGIDEAARIVAAAGGSERTALSLAGYGDLLASMEQATRPETRIGAALAKGSSLEAAIASVEGRVEALDLLPKVLAFAEKKGVSTSIFAAISRGMLSGRPTAEILGELMRAPAYRLPV